MNFEYELERKEADSIRRYIDEHPNYKPRARDLAYIVAYPSREVEETFEQMKRWIREGLSPASDGTFLSSRMTW